MIAIKSLSLLVFLICFDCIFCDANVATLKGISRKKYGSAIVSFNSVLLIDQQYYRDNKNVIFQKCTKPVAVAYQNDDHLVGAKIECADIVIIREFIKLNWEVKSSTTTVSKDGYQINYWTLIKQN